MTDRYDEMNGNALARELETRELPVNGKVDELRARLREDDEAKVLIGQHPDVEDESQEPEIPDPREPRREEVYGVRLTEDQARQLNAGTARIRQFTKHVNPVSALKFAAGDEVLVLAAPEDTAARVLPFGVEITLDVQQSDEG